MSVETPRDASATRRPTPVVGKKPQFLRLKAAAAAGACTTNQTGASKVPSQLHNDRGSTKEPRAPSQPSEDVPSEGAQFSPPVAKEDRATESMNGHWEAGDKDQTGRGAASDAMTENEIGTTASDTDDTTEQNIQDDEDAESERQADAPDDTVYQDPLQEQVDALVRRFNLLQHHPALTGLEDRIATLEAEEDDMGSDYTSDDEADQVGLGFCKADPCINVMTMNEWDKRKLEREHPHALLDVVVDPLYFGDKKDHDMMTSPIFQDDSAGNLEHQEGRAEYVKFVQINSIPFRYVYHYMFPSDMKTKPMIMLAPFKGFTIFENEYKQMLENLESKWKDRATEDPRAQVSVKYYNRSSDTIQDEEDPPHYDSEDLARESYEAYLALKCCREFLERFVKPRWDWLRSDSVETVGFGDLCDLFQPGDDVYQPGNTQRVWRVCKITGGRPILRHLLYGKLDVEGTLDQAGDGPTTRHQHNEAKRQGEDDSTMDSSNIDADWTPLHVEGYYLDFDGQDYGPVHKHLQIKYFPGKKSTQSLKLWPLRLARKDPDQYDRLTSPGIRFFEKCQPALHYYDGRTLPEGPDERLLRDYLGKSKAQDVTSAVYIDFNKAFQYNPDWSPDIGLKYFQSPDNRETSISATENLPLDSRFRFGPSGVWEFRVQHLDFVDSWALKRYRQTDEWIREAEGSSWSDRTTIKRADQILFPNRLYGFVFQTRDWACFDVDERHLKDAARDDRPWNELALPDRYKQTLESLVELYFSNKQAMAKYGKAGIEFDFINGKGSGLVVLLHGEPGVGKTSTAETIATKYEKPLLPITCGNLGIDAPSVERNLNDNFQLAQAWDAIVLLDEAEIFLQKRDRTNLERNALVSVFLRTLEYYTGIIFLTTNRVGAFDDAFISRVHCALYYPPLTIEQNEQIWKNNLRRLRRQRRLDGNILSIVGDGEEILNFARSHFVDRHDLGITRVWNGRQIRNSFQTAMALAEYEAKEHREKEGDPSLKVALRAHHFDTVAKASAEFESYLEITRGQHAAEIADEHQERAANYSAVTPLGRRQYDDSQSSKGWMNQPYMTAAPMQNDPGTPIPGADLHRRPTFNSRIAQEKRGHTYAANVQGHGHACPQEAPGTSTASSGYATVMTSQGPQMLPLADVQAMQPHIGQKTSG